MQNKYNYIITSLIIMIIIVIAMIVLDRNNESGGMVSQDTLPMDSEKPITDLEPLSYNDYNVPEFISKALAVKMVALIKEDKISIQVKDREIDFRDSQPEDWYDKYFNVAIIEGWVAENDDTLNPLESLTYKEAGLIADTFQAEVNINSNNLDEPIPYREWLTIYETIFTQIGDSADFRIEDLYVFATPSVSSELSAWQMTTDKGPYFFEGVTLDGCLEKKMRVFVRNNEVLYIHGIVEDHPVLTNAYIDSVNSQLNTMDVFMGGIQRTFTYSDSISVQESSGMIADIKIVEGNIDTFEEKNTTIRGVVKKISEEEIEVDGYGVLKIDESAKYYNVYSEIQFTNYRDVIVGYDASDFYIDEDNQLIAALINKPVKINDIRVVLNNSDFTSLIHSKVILTCEQDYLVKKGNVEQKIGEDHELDLENVKFEVGERIKIIPDEGGKITIHTINRGWGDNTFAPSYRGILEVEKVEAGYKLINEVDFEEYLYSVVPSEMPSSYGVEAAKVQAICARSYAYSSFFANAYSEHGAHVDDSTSCQVYNNVKETEGAIQAVGETKGQLLSFQDQVISTNFFSTSPGVTSDVGDVWANYSTKEFPTTSASYLKTKYQSDANELTLNLSKEEDFRTFIMDKNFPSFESQFSWYRWKVEMTAEQIQKTLNANIKERYEANPKLIKTLDENNVFRSRPIENIGIVEDIWIYSRGNSGIITEVIVESTTGVYKIASEYNIRKLIAPVNYVDGAKDIILTRKDGGESTNMSIMPSAYYVMDPIYDETGKLQKITFHGGGYGHGVGMSQNGVKAMIDLGYTYEEILYHYYEGTKIMFIE